ncbi:hypothetical protein [Virgibacillus ainsalahensis]
MNNHKYYVSGNTAEGFINFLPSNVKDFKQVIILKHPSLALKTAIIEKIIHRSNQQAEILLSAQGNKYLDGVIIRGKSLAIIDDKIATDDLAGSIELDLSLFLKDKLYLTDDYMEKNSQYQNEIGYAHANFAEGLKIHDDLEEIYIDEMDFEKADQLTKKFITNLLQGAPKKNQSAHVYHRLFGTNTSDGVVNVVLHLIQNISNVYHVKGRAGTGKSTFMKKVAKACEDYGFDTEIYHCSFDPNSLDMVLVRELDFCMFDSTDPHAFSPQAEDSIMDLYEETVTPGTDEKFASKINEVHTNYKSRMKKGIQHLKQAGKHLDRLEESHRFTDTELAKITTFITENIFN